VSLDTTINKADITLLLSGSPTLCTAVGICTLTAGTLNLNNFVLTTGRFNSSNANVRTITTGAGSFTVTGNAATVWSTGNATNLTYTSGFPTVNATYSGSVGTRIFNIAGTTDRINLNITAGSDIISPVSTFTVNNYNFTGFSGTLANISSIIYGNLTLSTGMTVSAGANTFEFRGISGTNTITSNGKTMDFPIIFNTAGVTFQLQDALTSGSTRTITLTQGTLNLVSYTLTTGIFSSSNANVRTLAFGTGNIVLTGNAATIWTTATVTGLTISGTPVVNATYSGVTGTRTITFGALSETNSISLNVSAGTDIVALTATSSFKNLVFTGFAGTLTNTAMTIYGNLTLVSGMTLTAGASATTFAATSGTKTITSAGKTIDYPVTFNGVGGTWACQDALTLGSTRALTMTNGTLQLKAGTTSTVGSFVTFGTNGKYLLSTTFGTAATISQASGTNTVQYLTVQDSIATGGAVFNALAITNVDAGNNTGWLFSTTPSIGNEITMRLRSFTQPRRF
jgi:hypothetical protein